jgi:predicted nucleic acid-binding protein
VNGPIRKFVLDTQLFIQAFRDPGANEALQKFHGVFAPFEYFSVIVAQELRAGIQRPQDRKSLDKHVLRVFARANRMITPSADAWHRSGDILAQMAGKEGLDIAHVSKALGNDVLLALSCREAGCVLVTDNRRDFQRIRQFAQFEFIDPWPGWRYGVG